MIYLLKFGASFLLPPGIFLVIFIALSVYLWRRERITAKLLLGTTAIFYLLCTPFVAERLIGSLELRFEPPLEARGDVIIMLGGGATSDTPDVDGLGNLGGSAANRLLTAARLQKKLDLPVVLSGGQVYSDSGREAVIAKRMLLGLGVPEEKILIEDQSLNTKQNAQRVGQILKEKNYTRPILVTSAFHMERSVLNFAKQDVAVTPYPAGYTANRVSAFYFNKLAPSDGALADSCTFFREWLAIWVARLTH